MSFADKIRLTDERLDQTSYYELLGVKETATGAQITERYYELAGKFHPDRFALRADKATLSSLNRIYARLGEAKRVLSTPRSRADYDRALAKGKLRVESTVEAPPKLAKRDPATPMARNLYDGAMIELQLGNESSARAKLTLARQYEPGSQAIAAALERVRPKARSVVQAAAPVAAPVQRVPASPPASAVAPHPRIAPSPAKLTMDTLVAELARVQSSTAAAVLELEGTPSADAIERAYRSLVARYDPARTGALEDPLLLAMSRDLLSLYQSARAELLAARRGR